MEKVMNLIMNNRERIMEKDMNVKMCKRWKCGIKFVYVLEIDDNDRKKW
jgi:hypothetical protein